MAEKIDLKFRKRTFLLVSNLFIKFVKDKQNTKI